ncbi:MAG: hypothetical protein JJT82_08845 [Legionellaceae bacterium]|nr:hypothetical protein [Legionellaceae bacterium]
MQVETDKINLPALGDEANLKQLAGYMKEAQGHLEALKKELYKTIDAGFDDASGYNLNPGVETACNYAVKPSEFLEKAYTIQAYGADGEFLDNRDQPYINAGLEFAQYCDDPIKQPTSEQIFLNDVGRLVSAINSTLSQINKTQHSLKNGDSDEVAFHAGLVGDYAQIVLGSAEESKIVDVIPNQGVFDKVLSGLKNFVDGIKQFFANIGKDKNEMHVAAFQKIKEKYQQTVTKSEKNVIDEEHTKNNTTAPSGP